MYRSRPPVSLDEYVLKQFISFGLTGKNNVAAFVLELEQDFRQVVVELVGEETGRKLIP